MQEIKKQEVQYEKITNGHKTSIKVETNGTIKVNGNTIEMKGLPMESYDDPKVRAVNRILKNRDRVYNYIRTATDAGGNYIFGTHDYRDFLIIAAETNNIELIESLQDPLKNHVLVLDHKALAALLKNKAAMADPKIREFLINKLEDAFFYACWWKNGKEQSNILDILETVPRDLKGSFPTKALLEWRGEMVSKYLSPFIEEVDSMGEMAKSEFKKNSRSRSKLDNFANEIRGAISSMFRDPKVYPPEEVLTLITTKGTDLMDTFEKKSTVWRRIKNFLSNLTGLLPLFKRIKTETWAAERPRTAAVREVTAGFKNIVRRYQVLFKPKLDENSKEYENLEASRQVLLDKIKEIANMKTAWGAQALIRSGPTGVERTAKVFTDEDEKAEKQAKEKAEAEAKKQAETKEQEEDQTEFLKMRDDITERIAGSKLPEGKQPPQAKVNKEEQPPQPEADKIDKEKQFYVLKWETAVSLADKSFGRTAVTEEYYKVITDVNIYNEDSIKRALVKLEKIKEHLEARVLDEGRDNIDEDDGDQRKDDDSELPHM